MQKKLDSKPWNYNEITSAQFFVPKRYIVKFVMITIVMTQPNLSHEMGRYVITAGEVQDNQMSKGNCTVEIKQTQQHIHCYITT